MLDYIISTIEFKKKNLEASIYETHHHHREIVKISTTIFIKYCFDQLNLLNKAYYKVIRLRIVNY
jgi:hypothetical protein